MYRVTSRRRCMLSCILWVNKTLSWPYGRVAALPLFLGFWPIQNDRQSRGKKGLISIQITDVRHRIPKIYVRQLSEIKWSRNMVAIDREIILSKLFCSKDLKISVGRFQRFIYRYVFVLWIPPSKCKYKLFFWSKLVFWVIRDILSSKY